jgi:tetratricopeptide (TPR) repeat protein
MSVGNQGGDVKDSTSLALIAYYSTVSFAAFCAFFPEGRLWSGSSLGYLSRVLQTAWLAAAIVFPLPTLYWNHRIRLGKLDSAKAISRRSYLWITLTVSCGILFCFVSWRTQTHLLGDGMQMLQNLAKSNPNIRTREIGAEYLARFLKGLIGVGSSDTSLLVYQLVSWVSGALFLLVSAIFAWTYFKGSDKSILAFSLLCSGGYMLLFFGYVENYPPLIFAVAMFCMAGLLILEGKLPSWSILIPTALALLLHVVAATLIPAAVYLVVRRTKLGKGFSLLSVGKRGLMIGIAGLVSAFAVAWWATLDLYVRFAFVPIIADRFTLARYTLFSLEHLGDYLNMVLMMAPGVLVFLSALLMLRKGDRQASPAMMFLFIVTASTQAAIFLLDPKLGMSRDWDLFAFSGVPLLLLGVLSISTMRLSETAARLVLSLSIALAVFFLVPRIIVQNTPNLGALYAERCMRLDLQKNRTSLAILEGYYAETGDRASQTRVATLREHSFPQDRILLRARDLTESNRLAEARMVLDSAGELNPTNSEYWTGMSLYYLHSRNYDSALIAGEYADGLNPLNPFTLQYLAYAHLGRGERGDARKLLQRAIRIDSTAPVPIWQLATLCRDEGNRSNYISLLKEASGKKLAPARLITETVTELIKDNDYRGAMDVLIQFVRNGGDTLVAEQLVNTYPKLQSEFPTQPTDR